MSYDLASLLLFPILNSAGAIYTVLGLMLVLSAVCLPVPEEFTLLLGGYFVSLGYIEFWPTVYVLVAGILAADTVGYMAGRFAGDFIYRKALCHLPLVDDLLERAKYYFHSHGEKVIFFSRPLLSVRVVVPMLAGHFRARFITFLLWDALAAIPWTITLVYVSYYAGASLDLYTEIKEIKHIVFAIIGFALVIYTAMRFLKRIGWLKSSRGPS